MIFSPQFITKLHDGITVQRLLREKTFIIDASGFGYWSGCFVKGLYHGGVRRIPDRAASPLIFGGAIHKGLAANNLGEPLEACLSAVRTDAIERELDACLDPKRTTAKAVEMVEAYIHELTIQPSKKLAPVELNGIPLVEQNFALPLGEVETSLGKIDILWSGVMDILNYEENAIWVTDYKTTSMMGEKFVDDKVRSVQVHGYVWAARTLCQHLTRNVEGAQIEALCHRSAGFEFRRYKIPVHQWKIEEWKSEQLIACQNLINELATFIQTAEAVPNREGCVTKYGKCPYFDLCESPTIMRERTLFSAFYKDDDWNPSGAE